MCCHGQQIPPPHTHPVFSCPVMHNIAIHEWTWLKVDATLYQPCNHSFFAVSFIVDLWMNYFHTEGFTVRPDYPFQALLWATNFPPIGKLLKAVFQWFLQGMMRLKSEFCANETKVLMQPMWCLRAVLPDGPAVLAGTWQVLITYLLCVYICRRPE